MEALIWIACIVGYVLVAAFVFGATHRLVLTTRTSWYSKGPWETPVPLLSGMFWVLTVPGYLAYLIGGQISNLGFKLIEYRLVQAKKELVHQKKVAKDLEDTEAEIAKALAQLR